MIIDNFGREITYLRISVTDKCNFRCTYCMPEAGVPFKPHSQVLRYEEIGKIAQSAGWLGFKKIRLTGGEPLLKKNIDRLVSMISQTGFYNDIAMTTNGSLLTLTKARQLKDAGLHRVNISLDTLDHLKFARITRGGDIRGVLSGIESAISAGLRPVKVNMVIFPDTAEEEFYRMREFCNEYGLILQTIGRFTLHDRQRFEGTCVPIDRPQPCMNCNRLRLTCDGYFKSCLFSDREIKVNFNDIEAGILEAIRVKPEYGVSCRTRTMSQIGG